MQSALNSFVQIGGSTKAGRSYRELKDADSPQNDDQGGLSHNRAHARMVLTKEQTDFMENH